MDRPRHGDWMQTASGKLFWPLDPRPEEVEISDIALSLANSCRYTGHCEYYSVAEHSVLVSRIVPEELAAWGLFHDAAEAYLADIARPVKRFLWVETERDPITGAEMAPVADIEHGILAAIAEHLARIYHIEIALPIPEEVLRADRALLADEQRRLMWPPAAEWNLQEEPSGIEIHCWAPERARAEWLARFQQIYRRAALKVRAEMACNVKKIA